MSARVQNAARAVLWYICLCGHRDFSLSSLLVFVNASVCV